MPIDSALYMFISLAPQGDSITLIKQVDENWVEGKLGDKVGIFPLQFTEVRVNL